MVFVLIIQLSTTALAASSDAHLAVTPADQIIEEEIPTSRASLLFPDVFDNGGISLTLIHTLTANGVGSSLLLNSAKTITRGNLPSDAVKIYITGKLTHNGFSNGTEDVIRTGLCYLNPDSGLYIGAFYEQVPSGTSFTDFLNNVTSLNRNATYLPYIKNLEPSYGRVSGSVGFYYSKV